MLDIKAEPQGVPGVALRQTEDEVCSWKSIIAKGLADPLAQWG